MLLPALQYGDWKDVRPRVKAAVRRIKRGEDFLSVMAADGMLETETTEGMLIVGGTLRPGRTSFHVLEPWKHLGDAIADDEPGRALEEQIFQASLTVPWGVLGLMVPACTLWFTGQPQWWEPFLHAAIQSWDQIAAVGARYFWALHPEGMWDIPNSLHYVLGRLGVPEELLNKPLPPGGPSALLKHARLGS